MPILVSEKVKNKLKNIKLQPHCWVLDDIREAASQIEPNHTICFECKICHKYEVIDVKSLDPFLNGYLPSLNNFYNKNECIGISKEELFDISEYKHIYFDKISDNVSKKTKNKLCEKIHKHYSFVVDDFVPFYINDDKAEKLYNSPCGELYSWRNRLTGISENLSFSRFFAEIQPRKVHKKEIELLYGEVEYIHFELHGNPTIYTENKIILLESGEGYEYFTEISKNPLD